MHFEDPTEPSTDSITEVAARKASEAARWVAKLKMEVFSFLLMLVGLLATVDPDIIIAVLPQKYHGWVILATALSVWILRRFVDGPPEPIIGRRRTHNR